MLNEQIIKEAKDLAYSTKVSIEYNKNRILSITVAGIIEAFLNDVQTKFIPVSDIISSGEYLKLNYIKESLYHGNN